MTMRASMLCVVSCCVLSAQNPPSPSFEAASIKIVDLAHYRFGVEPRKRGGPGTSDPTRIVWHLQNLRGLIAVAWTVDGEQVVGPSWLGANDEVYDLTATMAPGTTPETFRLMLQNFLIERFKLELHHETRISPAYDLIVAKGGPRLKPAADPDAPEVWVKPNLGFDADGFLVLPPGHGFASARRNGGVFMKFQSFSLPEFGSRIDYWVRQASGIAAIRVVDKTALQGKFDFTLKFSPGEASDTVVGPAVRARMEARGTAAPGADAAALDGIFKAVGKQLGLQLRKNPKGAALDTIVVDRCEKRPVE